MNKNFVKNLSSDKPERDNFSLDSLFESAEGSKLNFFSSSPKNGYVADTFIRPPVNIKIDLKEPIFLHSIIINGKVNTQISHGFIISTTTSFLKSEEKSDSRFFKQISKCLNDKNKDYHVYKFTRRRRNEENFTSSEPINIAYFNANPLVFIDKVTSINIEINRTLSSSQPCLKSVQILGFRLNQSPECIDLTSVNNTETKSETVSVPEEFIDELTHEIMRMPIKLPSNKMVDKSTLDKYLKELELNKKPDQDPFTCIPFTSKYKPLIDEHLKSKIDRFFLDNQTLKFIKPQIQSASKKRTSNDQPPVYETNRSIKRTRSNLGSNSDSKVKKDLKCNCCLNQKTEKILLYEILSCKHHFCKDCLQYLNKTCSVCKNKFDNSQVINIDRLNLGR